MKHLSNGSISSTIREFSWPRRDWTQSSSVSYWVQGAWTTPPCVALDAFMWECGTGALPPLWRPPDTRERKRADGQRRWRRVAHGGKRSLRRPAVRARVWKRRSRREGRAQWRSRSPGRALRLAPSAWYPEGGGAQPRQPRQHHYPSQRLERHAPFCCRCRRRASSFPDYGGVSVRRRRTPPPVCPPSRSSVLPSGGGGARARGLRRRGNPGKARALPDCSREPGRRPDMSRTRGI